MSYTRVLIQHDERPDFRSFSKTRTHSIDQKNSSFILSSQKTLLIVNYSISTTQPHADKPHQGIVKINTSLNKKPRKHSSVDLDITTQLKKVFIANRCIDLESLLILYNELCFMVIFEIHVVESDGDLLRFCVEALMYAIERIRIDKMCLRKLQMSCEYNLTEYEVSNKILLNFRPSCFYFVGIGGKVVCDPVAEECCEMEWDCVVLCDGVHFLYCEKMGAECTYDDFIRLLI